MRLLDCRRLPGPNLLWSRPGAVIDIEFGAESPDLVIGAWQKAARRLLDDINWKEEETCIRRFEGGASCAISAPVDALYTATEIIEAAWDAARDMIEGGNRHVMLRLARQLREEVRDEERPRLQRLIAAARERSLPVVLDTDEVSIGLGAHSETWRLGDVPHPDDVDWSTFGSIPVALVTGTNGKTTTVRLLGSIGAAAELTTGISSTDWMAIGGEVIERDDYAGPEGARRILRDPRCELAILETARGGLLRRGLAVERADAALITNIAADHLGEFGVQNLDELADVKWVVTRALGNHGTAVLNADEPRLVARAGELAGPIIWFSPDGANATMKAHAAAGGTYCTIDRGRIVVGTGDTRMPIVSIKQIPVCFGGAAVHNVANALGAAALAHALGIEHDAIARGLRSLEDNPGRSNLYDVNGVSVLLDFAHNPHGLRAMVAMASRMPANRRALVIGQAGDRSDEDIRELVMASGELRFDRVFVKRMEKLSRGREPGAVASLMRKSFRELGYPAGNIRTIQHELGALRAALRWAGPGDQIVFLSHEDRANVRAELERLSGKG